MARGYGLEYSTCTDSHSADVPNEHIWSMARLLLILLPNRTVRGYGVLGYGIQRVKVLGCRVLDPQGFKAGCTSASGSDCAFFFSFCTSTNERPAQLTKYTAEGCVAPSKRMLKWPRFHLGIIDDCSSSTPMRLRVKVRVYGTPTGGGMSRPGVVTLMHRVNVQGKSGFERVLSVTWRCAE